VTGEDLGFVHRFEPGTGQTPMTLLLLHGTGGNEQDMLGLGRSLHPEAALLSPRGKVLEGDNPRWFRRIAEGVFDLEDLQRRTHELADFIEVAAAAYKLDPDRIVAVGYSNGANIAASLLLLRPPVLAGAILLRPMVPFKPDPLPNLHGKRVLVEAGRQDPIAPPSQPAQLAAMLQLTGALVTVYWHEGGHALTQRDVTVGRQCLMTHKSALL
jgi:predicted esterase